MIRPADQEQTNAPFCFQLFQNFHASSLHFLVELPKRLKALLTGKVAFIARDFETLGPRLEHLLLEIVWLDECYGWIHVLDSGSLEEIDLFREGCFNDFGGARDNWAGCGLHHPCYKSGQVSNAREENVVQGRVFMFAEKQIMHVRLGHLDG